MEDGIRGETGPPLILPLVAVSSRRQSEIGSKAARLGELLAAGVRFEYARTPAPLTAPAMASVFTSLYPHDHGSTRNGLSVRPKLVSFSSLMQRRGYRTAAGPVCSKPVVSICRHSFSFAGAMITMLGRQRIKL